LRAKWGPGKPTISATGLFVAATPNLCPFSRGPIGHLLGKLPMAGLVPVFPIGAPKK
jgi:hypothetical protein